MITYLETLNTLHTRGVEIDNKDYIFAILYVMGEPKENAYAFAYDEAEFKRHIGTEGEARYLRAKQIDADRMLAQQGVTQLVELLTESYRAELQKRALNLTDYKFSGEETVKILNSLLKSRIEDLESSSVKDVIGIIKTLTDQGALESGDGGFSKHFIQIYPKFNALCVKCGREFEIARGLHGVCPHCNQVYKYDGDADCFYPEPMTL